MDRLNRHVLRDHDAEVTTDFVVVLARLVIRLVRWLAMMRQ
jgi:hypothetical protein